MHPPLAAGPTRRRASAISTGWKLVQYHVLKPTLDLIFPPVCVGCGRVGMLLCDRCIQSFAAPPQIDDTPHPLTDLCALGLFEGPLQKAVHAFKYEYLTDLAEPLGALMACRIQEAGWPPGLIIPVPLHETRYHERGFNQSALLGSAIARQLNWTHDSGLLIRTRSTRSQVGLNYQERQENMKDAFVVVNPASLREMNIILVDDVCTTGATLRECATTLLTAGARSVRASVVGRAAADSR